MFHDAMYQLTTFDDTRTGVLIPWTDRSGQIRDLPLSAISSLAW